MFRKEMTLMPSRANVTIRPLFLKFFMSLVCLAVANGAQTVTSQATTKEASADLAQRIERVENGIPPISLGENEPPLRVNLRKLMEAYKVPGLSVAVIDNFKIVWVKGYGVTESGGTAPVTTKTLFQAGSISKPVAATGTLY